MLADDGQFHLFVSEIAGKGCGLCMWRSQSQIVHATAAQANGPFDVKDVALLPEAHNPYALRWGMHWYLFHIGPGLNRTIHDCPPNTEICRGDERHTLRAAKSTNQIHQSTSPYGPWVPANTTMPPCVNPSPWLLPNGTLAVACTGSSARQNNWTLLTANNLSENWTSRDIFAGVSPPSVWPHKFWEDPMLYTDRRNHWHILAHTYSPHQNADRDYVSGHLYSEDGIDWIESAIEPYRHAVQFAGDKVQNFSTIERPKLLFDSNGTATHLFNGVSPSWPCSTCGGCTSCKVSPGKDWTYTMVRQLLV